MRNKKLIMLKILVLITTISFFEFYSVTPSDPTPISELPGDSTGLITTITLTSFADDLEVCGNYLYVTDYYDGLLVYDISDINNPVLCDSYDPGDRNWHIKKEGSIVYLTGDMYMRAINVSDPNNIEYLSHSGEVFYGMEFDIQGNIAYVPRMTNGISTVNISRPESLSLDPILDTVNPHSSDSAFEVVVRNDLAYIAYGGAGLSIFNVSDPTNIFEICNLSAAYGARGVELKGDIAYVSCSTDGMHVVNISDPYNPFIEMSFTTGIRSNEIKIYDDLLFSVGGLYELNCFNITNRAHPIEIADQYTQGGNALDISDTYVFISESTEGIGIYQISSFLDEPELITTYDISEDCRAVAIDGDIVVFAGYTTGDETVYTGNLTASQQIDVLDSITMPGSIRDIVIDGHLAWIACYSGDLVCLNISNPGDIQLVDSISVTGDVCDVDIEGDFAYIAARGGGLRVFDVSDPTNAFEIDYYDTGDLTYKVDVQGDVAYVAEFYFPIIRCYDISDPYNISPLGYLESSGTDYYDIAVQGDLAILSRYGSNSGLDLVNISDPTSPELIDFYITSTTNVPQDVIIYGNYAFVSESSEGLVIYNISDPSNVEEIGSYDTDGNAQKSVLDGRFLYVADGSDGLVVLQVFQSGDDDFDGDNIGYLEEVWDYNTNPELNDTDSDGLTDDYELFTSSTDPLDPDHDDDGMPDGWEVDNSLNPADDSDNITDIDDDDLIAVYEYGNNTDPNSNDTDLDSMDDLWEILNSLQATVGTDNMSDDDNDNLYAVYEYLNGTDPNDPDCDDDGLLDGDELILYSSLPLDNDTDNDSMPDGWEVDNGFLVNDGDDNLTDADTDGLQNLYEYLYESDPNDPDTDDDGMPDGWEVDNGFLVNDGEDNITDIDTDGLLNLYEYQNDGDPNDPDTDDDGMPDGWEYDNDLAVNDDSDKLGDLDGDGLLNIYEYLNGTDPNNSDTDGDGFSDSEEIAKFTDPLDPNSHPTTFMGNLWQIILGVVGIGAFVGVVVVKTKKKGDKPKISRNNEKEEND